MAKNFFFFFWWFLLLFTYFFSEVISMVFGPAVIWSQWCQIKEVRLYDIIVYIEKFQWYFKWVKIFDFENFFSFIIFLVVFIFISLFLGIQFRSSNVLICFVFFWRLDFRYFFFPKCLMRLKLFMPDFIFHMIWREKKRKSFIYFLNGMFA